MHSSTRSTNSGHRLERRQPSEYLFTSLSEEPAVVARPIGIAAMAVTWRWIVREERTRAESDRAIAP
jgi:hypothetical protein